MPQNTFKKSWNIPKIKGGKAKLLNLIFIQTVFFEIYKDRYSYKARE